MKMKKGRGGRGVSGSFNEYAKHPDATISFAFRSNAFESNAFEGDDMKGSNYSTHGSAWSPK